jgi:hypothetical protein
MSDEQGNANRTRPEAPGGPNDVGEAPQAAPSRETPPRLFEPGCYLSIPYAVMARKDLNSSAKLIWMAVVSHCRPGARVAWPSVHRLQSMTGLGKEAVIEGIRRLEAAGLLTVDRADGQHSRYTIWQPEATFEKGNGAGKIERSENPTGRKTRPVGEADRTGRKTRPQPVGISDPNYSKRTTQRTIPPNPPEAGGEVQALLPKVSLPESDTSEQDPMPEAEVPADVFVENVENTVAAEEAAGDGARGKATRTPTSAECAEQAVERINEAWLAVRGVELPSNVRRRVRRGWDNGDKGWLELVDTAAIVGGMTMAEKAQGTFGLGWVRDYVEAQAAKRQAGQATADAMADKQRKAQHQADREARQQRLNGAIEAERVARWEALAQPKRELLLTAARQKFGDGPVSLTPKLLQRFAMAMAWPAEVIEPVLAAEGRLP